MRNRGSWSSGEQFGEEVDAAEVYLNGGCSNFKDCMSIGDEGSYCDDVDRGEMEVVEGVE